MLLFFYPANLSTLFSIGGKAAFFLFRANRSPSAFMLPLLSAFFWQVSCGGFSFFTEDNPSGQIPRAEYLCNFFCFFFFFSDEFPSLREFS